MPCVYDVVVDDLTGEPEHDSSTGQTRDKILDEMKHRIGKIIPTPYLRGSFDTSC